MPFVDAHNYEHDRADIFISASHIDWPRVRILAEALAAADFRIFHTALDAIRPGVDYRAVVHHYLRHSRSIVVCWSPTSVESQWVTSEAQFGLDKNKLVACKVVPCKLMPPFNTFQTADLSDWRGDEAHPQWRDLMQLLQHRKSGVVAAFDPVERLLGARTRAYAGPLLWWRTSPQAIIASLALVATLLLGVAIGALLR